jgi:carbamoyl-phosphate synthase large subunit
MTSILVTAVGGDIGQALVSIVRKHRIADQVYGSDISITHGGKYEVDCFLQSPGAEDSLYVDWLNDIISQNGINLVVPVNDFEIQKLMGIDFNSTKFIMPNVQSIEVGFDKYYTFKFLESVGIPTPKTYLPDVNNDLIFPVLIKPRTGRGSKGIFVCKNIEEMRHYEAVSNDYLIQEVLVPSSEEYTCGVFRSSKGEIRTMVFLRKLTGGQTSWAQVIESEEISTLCETLASSLNLIGSINVQLIFTVEGPKIFEINSRFSSTVAMRDELGFHDFLWAIQDAQNQSISDYYPPKSGVEVYKLASVKVGTRGE